MNKFWKSVTYPLTNNVDTRDPTGSKKMQNVKFKSSSIIYSFITVMIVIFLLNEICDLKYINDKKTEVNESMTYEAQLNMFLSNSK